MRNSHPIMPLTTNEILAALQFRYATKTFDADRKIPAETWAAIEQSLVLTPSSFGLQPWKFIVVSSPEIRAQLRAASWDQPQLTDASHLVVLTARTDLDTADIDRWINRLSEVQGTPVENLAPLAGMIGSFASVMSPAEKQTWNTRQLYIALGQLMTAAALLGIDTCPLEGISAPEYDRILNLQSGPYATAVACALGYRSSSDKYANAPKARFPLDAVIERV